MIVVDFFQEAIDVIFGPAELRQDDSPAQLSVVVSDEQESAEAWANRIRENYTEGSDVSTVRVGVNTFYCFYPTETQFYWNLGTQYYRSGDYSRALEYFRIAIQGGVGKDGAVVKGIPLSYENRVPELYYMYGLILARSGQCQEAAEVVRLLTQGVPDDVTAVLNAEYMTEVCKEGDFDIVLSPVSLESPTAEPEETDEEELLLENNYRE